MILMGVAFRTTAGPTIGLGHLRRCVTLAQALQLHGIVCHFSIDHDPAALRFLREYGFDGIEERDKHDLIRTLEYLERWGARALVVDSYAIEDGRLGQLKGPFVVVIDDLGGRPLPVDLIVNGSANAAELTYCTRPETQLLLGPEYVLLREEFSREPQRTVRGRVERVLISVGGTDRFQLTSRMVAWTHEALGQVVTDVVVGPFFSQDAVQELEQLAENSQGIVVLHRDPPYMRELMLACDLAVAGGGQTAYELAATGTPAVAIRLADNQTGNLKGLSGSGALTWVGDASDRDLHGKAVVALVELSVDPKHRREMGRTGRRLVDGRGAKRVAQAIMEACQN